MDKIKRIFYNPWTIGIGSIIVAQIGLKFIDNVWGTNIYSVVLSFIVDFLTFKIPIWLFLICLSIIFIIGKLKTKKQFNPPDFTGYTEDTFEDTLYKWEYSYDKKSKKYEISKIKPYCSDCRFPIVNG